MVFLDSWIPATEFQFAVHKHTIFGQQLSIQFSVILFFEKEEFLSKVRFTIIINFRSVVTSLLYVVFKMYREMLQFDIVHI